MPLATTCPNCRAVYQLADHLHGKTVRCKKCQGAIVVGNGSIARSEDKTKVPAAGKRPQRKQEKEPPRRKKSDGNRLLIIGLLAGGLALMLLAGGILAVVLLSGRLGGKAADLLVDVSGPWPEPMPFPAIAGYVAPDTVVTIHVANVADKYVREDVGDKLGALVDNGRPCSTGSSHEGRLTILLAPVKDAQAFADKIDFATVRSVKGRIITVVARKVDGPPPNADDVTVALYRLKSPRSGRRAEGARLLKGMRPDQRRAELLQKPDPRRAEVLRALEAALDDPDRFTRDEVCQALGVWGGKETVPALLKAMQKEETRTSAIQALGRIKDPSASEALAGCLANFFSRGPATEALKAIGPPAESAVLKYLHDADPRVREQACHVLQDIGGPRSREELEQLLDDKDASVAGTAKSTLESMSRRR